MKHLPVWGGIALSLAALLSGAGTGEAQARYTRRTPIVEAVARTRQGILTIKSTIRGNWGPKDIVGTGVIVDARGYAVTNAHVVKDCAQPTVVLCDGTKLTARTHVLELEQDLAILRLPEGRTYQELAFAPGSDLMVGEDVISVGNPFGYTNTVSTGIISALGRSIEMPTSVVLKNLIQHNASINPGNSGGPLLNINGELIGINVAIREGAQGIAFALNADTVRDVLTRHLSARKVAHVDHGIRGEDRVLEPEGEARQRVVVCEVSSSGPAAEAGIRKDDVILRVGDREVTSRFDLERALWSYGKGDRVKAAILRDGQEQLISLTLAGESQPRAAAQAAAPGQATAATQAAGHASRPAPLPPPQVNTYYYYYR